MTTSRRSLTVIGALAIAAAAWTTATAQPGRSGDRQREFNRLSGTYQLDRGRSDDPERAVERATRSLRQGDRDRVYRNLINRLDSPETLAIDLNGRSVTIVSSNAPRLMFDADGQEIDETGSGDRRMFTRADLDRDALMVTTSGYRGSGFTVRFEPVAGDLRVTRQFDSEYLQTPVLVQSFYRRVAAEPRWSVYDDGGRGVLVPDGTRLTVRLDRRLTTRTSREGERFTLTVVGSGVYRGAVINGVVARAVGRGGHAEMAFDFDRIRLRDGRSGPFEGEIESITVPGEGRIRVDRPGAIRDRDRRDESIGRDAAVGAALGAILGAIVGGGKGAAIGAIIGGAGTILAEGLDELILPAGTQLTVSASSRR
jgi:outer membrane lipoprotein SlyB